MRLVFLLLDVPKIRLASAIFANIVNGVSTVAALICILHSLRGGTLAVVAVRLLCRAGSRKPGLRADYAQTADGGIPPPPAPPHASVGSQNSAGTIRAHRRGKAIGSFHVRLGESLAPRCAISFICFPARPSCWRVLPISAGCRRSEALVVAFLLLLAIAVAVLLRPLEKTHGRATRMAWDRVVQVFRTVLEGIKQMRLNRTLARQVLRTFDDRARDMQRTAGRAAGIPRPSPSGFNRSRLSFSGSRYSVLSSDIATLVAGGYGVLALIYMRWPLQSLIADSSGFADAAVALQRLNELGLDLSRDIRPADRPSQPRTAVRKILLSPKWNTLTLHDVAFRYDAGHPDDDFALGPINIVLHPEQIVFISGGNGSGKTTLLKILTGLYTPTKGTIHFDDLARR